MIQLIREYSQGNPGAITFLMKLFTEEIIHSIPISIKLEQCPTLKGTNLYVLWSDLCNKDFALTAELCKVCPNDVLEDACSRQDYSGRELVKPYFDVIDLQNLCEQNSFESTLGQAE